MYTEAPIGFQGLMPMYYCFLALLLALQVGESELEITMHLVTCFYLFFLQTSPDFVNIAMAIVVFGFSYTLEKIPLKVSAFEIPKFPSK